MKAGYGINISKVLLFFGRRVKGVIRPDTVWHDRLIGENPYPTSIYKWLGILYVN